MNTTIMRLATASLWGRWRGWALVALPVLVAALGFLIGQLDTDPATGWDLLVGVWIPLVVPLVSLLAASAVLGPEIDDGSLLYLLAKPVDRHSVLRSKYLVAASSALALLTVPLLVVGVLMPSDSGSRPGALAWGLTVGSAVATLAYVALFLLLTVLLRRSVIAAIIYIFVIEQVVVNMLSGAAVLSISAAGGRIAREFAWFAGAPDVALWWAWAAPLVVVVAGTWWAGDRLRNFTVRNDD